MTKEFFDKLPYGVWPKQRIFLSIDIIDSTLLKVTDSQEINLSNTQQSSKWTEQFFNFFSNAPPLFSKYYQENTTNKCTDACGKNIPLSVQKYQTRCNSPVKWKILGDEVIFTENLICKLQVYYCLKALEETINELHKTIDLKFKGTAWVTGVPVANAPLRFQLAENMYNSHHPYTHKGNHDSHDVRTIDVIGSSMDLGFRLAKLSTETKLVISTSFLKLLLDAQDLINEKNRYSVYSNGFQAIRGMKDGKHPLFWIIPENHNALESSLLTPTEPKLLREFLKEYLTDNSPFIFDPENLEQADYWEKFENAIKYQGRLPGSVYQLYYSSECVDSEENAMEDAQKYIMSKLAKTSQNFDICK